MNIKKELENIWNFSHLLIEIAVPAALVLWSLEKEGLFKNALIVGASIMAINAIVNLYSIVRSK
ncbi:MAG TPA: hypothetical protein VJ841_02235 [Candidatus Saccharimonadales bacterium]|nr:hypothetical protein [Candidatus Saccharimonadales bacterium]